MSMVTLTVDSDNSSQNRTENDDLTTLTSVPLGGEGHGASETLTLPAPPWRDQDRLKEVLGYYLSLNIMIKCWLLLLC